MAIGIGSTATELTMSLVRRSPDRNSPVCRGRNALGSIALLVAAAAATVLLSAPARADEPVVVAAAAPTVPPRQAALEVAIRRLERHLASLRKSRTELESGRPEPVPADDAARRRTDVDHRTLREVTRYESARAKALAALTEAETAKDAAKIGDAAAALDVLDTKFVDTVKKLEESLDAPPAKAAAGDPKPADSKAGEPKSGDSPAPKKAPKPTTKPTTKPGDAPPAKPAGKEKSKPMGNSADDSGAGDVAVRDTLDDDGLDDEADDVDDDFAD